MLYNNTSELNETATPANRETGTPAPTVWLGTSLTSLGLHLGAERRAAALVDLCRWFLDNSTSTSSASRTRPHVSVVVGLNELASGSPGQLGETGRKGTVLVFRWTGVSTG